LSSGAFKKEFVIFLFRFCRVICHSRIRLPDLGVTSCNRQNAIIRSCVLTNQILVLWTGRHISKY